MNDPEVLSTIVAVSIILFMYTIICLFAGYMIRGLVNIKKANIIMRNLKNVVDKQSIDEANEEESKLRKKHKKERDEDMG